MTRTLAAVNTVVYGALSQGRNMTDQLSAKDWLDQGLKTLAESGFTALKAEPLAKAMGVSRGSFYWHFADIGAFHAAILKHWREIAAEQIIANLEAASEGRKSAARCCCAGCSAKGWRWRTRSAPGPASIPRRAAAVQAIDRRRLGYVESLLRRNRTIRPTSRAPARRSSIGRFSALRCRTSRCRKRGNRPCSTKCCGSPR